MQIFHPNFFVCSCFNLKLCKKSTMLSSFHSSYVSARFCIMHCQNYANLKLVWRENVVAFRVWGRNEWGYHLRELQQLQQKTFCHLFPRLLLFQLIRVHSAMRKIFFISLLALLHPANDNDNDIMNGRKGLKERREYLYLVVYIFCWKMFMFSMLFCSMRQRKFRSVGCRRTVRQHTITR